MAADRPSDLRVPLDAFLAAIRSACRRAGGVEPEDIVGEVYLRLQRALKNERARFTDESGLLAYARRIAINLINEDRRRTMRQARAVDPSALPDEPTGRPDAEGALPSAEQLLDALGEADPLVREAFRLHVESLTGKKIAARLGISESTVSRLLKRARMILREKFPDCFRGDVEGRSDP